MMHPVINTMFIFYLHFYFIEGNKEHGELRRGFKIKW